MFSQKTYRSLRKLWGHFDTVKSFVGGLISFPGALAGVVITMWGFASNTPLSYLLPLVFLTILVTVAIVNVLVDLFSYRSRVVQVNTSEDLYGAMFVYDMMPSYEKHSDQNIVDWWEEDRKRVPRSQRKSKEVYLLVKEGSTPQAILFATYSYEDRLFNIWGLASKKMFTEDQDTSLHKLGEKLNKIVRKQFPDCRGGVVEVDLNEERGALKRARFSRLARLFKTELTKVPVGYKMPNASFSGESGEESDLELFYIPTPQSQNKLNVNKTTDVQTMVHFMYDTIFSDCRADSKEFQGYLAKLESHVLASHSPPTSSGNS